MNPPLCSYSEHIIETMGDCDLEWRRFLSGEDISFANSETAESVETLNRDKYDIKHNYNQTMLIGDAEHDLEEQSSNSPAIKKCISAEEKPSRTSVEDIITDINISTTTKITYLNKMIDLKNDFWKINVIDYYTPEEGVIKKQMKYVIDNEEEQAYFDTMVKSQTLYTELMDLRKKNIIGTNKKVGKNVYKISIGIRSKDIINQKAKKSQAFFNCFVLIIRMKDANGVFTEVHMKIFNTGKIEIPGMKDNATFYKVLDIFKRIYKRDIGEEILLKKNDVETILINSNFNCGFFINREKLYTILKTKYNLNCSYDPCTYPGIQNVFYFENDGIELNFNGVITTNGTECTTNKKKDTTKNYVSFMVFRTGSILIVGKCDEDILYKIYEFIKNLLITEYEAINCGLNGYTVEQNQASDKSYRPIKYRHKLVC